MTTLCMAFEINDIPYSYKVLLKIISILVKLWYGKLHVTMPDKFCYLRRSTCGITAICVWLYSWIDKTSEYFVSIEYYKNSHRIYSCETLVSDATYPYGR